MKQSPVWATSQHRGQDVRDARPISGKAKERPSRPSSVKRLSSDACTDLTPRTKALPSTLKQRGHYFSNMRSSLPTQRQQPMKMVRWDGRVCTATPREGHVRTRPSRDVSRTKFSIQIDDRALDPTLRVASALHPSLISTNAESSTAVYSQIAGTATSNSPERVSSSPTHASVLASAESYHTLKRPCSAGTIPLWDLPKHSVAQCCIKATRLHTTSARAVAQSTAASHLKDRVIKVRTGDENSANFAQKKPASLGTESFDVREALSHVDRKVVVAVTLPALLETVDPENTRWVRQMLRPFGLRTRRIREG